MTPPDLQQYWENGNFSDKSELRVAENSISACTLSSMLNVCNSQLGIVNKCLVLRCLLDKETCVPVTASQDGAETKAAEEETKVMEAETEVTGAETKTAEVEMKDTEAETKIDEAETKVTEADSKVTEAESKAMEVEESEVTDSDAENKLNPDEYEDDTTEFEQSEAVANDESQNEVSACTLTWVLF